MAKRARSKKAPPTAEALVASEKAKATDRFKRLRKRRAARRLKYEEKVRHLSPNPLELFPGIVQHSTHLGVSERATLKARERTMRYLMWITRTRQDFEVSVRGMCDGVLDGSDYGLHNFTAVDCLDGMSAMAMVSVQNSHLQWVLGLKYFIMYLRVYQGWSYAMLHEAFGVELKRLHTWAKQGKWDAARKKYEERLQKFVEDDVCDMILEDLQDQFERNALLVDGLGEALHAATEQLHADIESGNDSSANYNRLMRMATAVNQTVTPFADMVNLAAEMKRAEGVAFSTHRIKGEYEGRVLNRHGVAAGRGKKKGAGAPSSQSS